MSASGLEMGCFAPPSSPAIFRFPSSICVAKKSKWRRVVVVQSKLSEDENPLLQAATNAACLRFQETNRPDPLFFDPYAGCFITALADKDRKQWHSTGFSCHYCLGTKFIDDKLMGAVKDTDVLRQMIASESLKVIGAEISKSCTLLHVPLESSDINGILHRKGFSGERPSIWVLQGLPVRTLESFKEILSIVGSLAMKGCIFLGELPLWLAETEFGTKSTTQKWMDKLFISNGFRVQVVAHDEVARSVNRDPPSGNYGKILFVAQQLQLSDDQMEAWRREFRRMEEEGDEEGFEEL